MKKTKKLLSVLLSILLIVSVLPMNAIEVFADESYDEITVGTPVTVNLTSGSENRYYLSFTPTVTGTYYFYSYDRGSIDPYGRLFDSTLNTQLAYNDDGAGDRNFAFTYVCEAGTTYLLACCTYNDSGTGSYTVMVSSTAPYSTIGLNKSNYTGVAGNSFTLTPNYSPSSSPAPTYQWASSDPSVATVSSGGTVTLISEGSATITLTIAENSSLSATCSVTVVTPAPIQLNTATSVNIANDGEKAYFSYTVPHGESGEYYFYSTSSGSSYEEGFIYDSNLNTLAVKQYSTTFKIGYYLTEDTTYYFCAGFTYSYVTGNYTVTLMKRPPVSTISFEEGSSLSGMAYDYSGLNVQYGPEDCVEEACTFTSSNDSIVSISESGDDYCTLHYESAGTAVITATTASGVSTTCTVTVTQPDALTEGVTYNIGSGTLSLIFTPTTSGSFYFDFSNYSTGTAYISKYLYNGFSYMTSTGEDRISADLTAGTTYVLKLSDYVGTYDVIVSKAVPATGIEFVTPAGMTGYREDSKTLYTRLLPSNAEYESITYTSSDEDVAVIGYSGTESSGARYCTVNLYEEGTAIITATSASGYTAQYTITVLPYPTITVGTPTVIAPSESSPKRATFTPAADGTYRFDFSDYSGNGNFEKELYNSNSNYINSTYDDILSVELEGGETYTLECYTSEGFTVNVTPLVAATSLVFTTDPGETDYPFNGLTLNTQLGPDNAIPEDVEFTSSDDSIVSINYFNNYDDGSAECYVNIEGFGTATITATSENGLTATYVITALSYPELTVGTAYTVPENDETDTVMFTPSEDGLYYFIFSDFTGYSGFEKDLYEGSNYLTYTYGTGINYNLEAGKTYILYCYGDCSYKIMVVKAAPPTTIELSTHELTGFEGTTGSIYYELGPEYCIDVDVTYSSSNENIVTVDEYGDISFIASGTATITATTENGLTDTCTVTVTEVPSIAVDQTIKVNISSPGQYAYYKFTPSVSGSYIFRSNGSYDTYGYIYDSNFSQIASNDDGGGNSQFSVSYELTAGQTYYFGARMYSDTDTGSFTVTLIHAVPITGIEFETDTVTASAYTTTTVYANLIYNGANYADEYVTFTVSDTSIAQTNGGTTSGARRGTWLRCLKPGTVTITATTSKSGFTDTMELTVVALPEMTLNTPYTFNHSSTSQTGIVAFTPTESGGYWFTTEGGDALISYFDGFTTLLERCSDSTVYFELTAGKTYVIKPSSFTGTRTVTVSKATPATGIHFRESTYTGYSYTNISVDALCDPANAIPEEVNFNVSDDTKLEIYDTEFYSEYGLSRAFVSLKEPGTVTINGTSTSGFTASCTVTVLPLPELTLDTPTVITNREHYNDNNFSFTPAVDGTYIFTSSDYSTIHLYEGFNEINDADTRLTAELEGGVTYRVNISAFTGSRTVTVTKAVPATSISFVDGTTATGYALTEHYLYLQFNSLNVIPEDISVTSSDDSIAEVDYVGDNGDGTYYVDLYLHDTGTVTLTAESENGLTATCTLTVVEAPELTLDLPYSFSSSTFEGYHFFRFTPTESGQYYVAGMDGYLYKYISHDFNFFNSSSENMLVSLQAGETYIIRCEGFIGSRSILVTQAVAPTSIIFEKSAYTGYEYTNLGIEANFGPEFALTEDVSCTTSDSSIASVDYCYIQYDHSIYANIECHQPGTVTLTATSTSGITASVELTVLSLPELQLGTPFTYYLGEDHPRVKFTPAADGNYTFVLSDIDSSIELDYLELGHEGGIFANCEGATKFSHDLDEGEPVYLGVGMRSYTFGRTFTVTVYESATPTSIAFDCGSSLTMRVPEYYPVQAVSSPEDAAVASCTYTSSNEDVVAVQQNYQNSVYLVAVAPGTATITATTQDGLTATCEVTVVAGESLVLDVPKTVTISGYHDQKFYTFTPSETGKYAFTCSNFTTEASAFLQLYQDSSHIDELYNSDVLYADLYAGMEYTVLADFDSSSYYGGTGSYDLTVSKAVAPTSISFAKDRVSGIAGTGAELPAIIASPTGSLPATYTYTSSNSNVAVVNESKTALNFLSAGTATITATSDNGLTATCTVTVTAPKTITLGVSDTAIITSNGADFFQFTPSESGTYKFYSTDAPFSATGAIIMNNSPVVSGSGNYENYDFSMTANLDAGVTYILGAAFIDENQGSFTVTIDRYIEVSAVKITKMPNLTAYNGATIGDKFDPSGMQVRITWSDGSKNNITFNGKDPITIGGNTVYADYEISGNKAYVVARCNDKQDKSALTFTSNPVTSIELAYPTIITVVSNTNGEWITNYVNGAKDEYFHYYVPFDNSTTPRLKINYYDGTSVVATVGETVNGDEITYTTNQSDTNRWVIDGDNLITVTYQDKSIDIPVTITPNDVAFLEIVTPTATTLVENTNGWETQTWEHGTYVNYYIYNLIRSDLSDTVVRINYNDGKQPVTAHLGDVVDGYYIGFEDGQYGNFWSVGTNYVTVTYKGAKVEMPIVVEPSPVESIVITQTPSREYIFGDTNVGHTETYHGIDCFFVDDVDIDGIVFRVNYENGTSRQFTYSDMQNGQFGGYDFRAYVQRGSSQPGTIEITFEYMGATATYTADLYENTVTGIEIVDQPDLSTVKAAYIIDPENMVVRVHFADGTYDNIVWDLGYYHFDEFGNAILQVSGGQQMILSHQNLPNGYRSYTVSYLGYTATLAGQQAGVWIADATFPTGFNGSFYTDLSMDVAYTDGTSARLSCYSLTEAEYDHEGVYVFSTEDGILLANVLTYTDDNDNPSVYEIYGIKQYGAIVWYANTNVAFVVEGDIDMDGEVDLYDYALLKSYLAGGSVPQAKIDIADMNNDGAVDAFDLYYLDKAINNQLESKYTYASINANTAKITKYNGNDAYVEIPAELGGYQITTLDNYTFRNCTSVVEVVLPYGVTKLNYGAFLGCTKLESITIPNTVTTFGTYCFKDCVNLKSVAIPNGMTAIGNSVFANCTSLESIMIPASVTSINANAFQGCTKLTTIYGAAGSYAQTFANANGYTFIII